MSASMVEGGNFKCGVHNLEFKSAKEFDDHNIETRHTVFGNARCVYCDELTSYAGLPYTRIGKPQYVVCDRCNQNEEGSFKRFRPYKLGDQTIVPPQLQKTEIKPGEKFIQGRQNNEGVNK